MKITPVSKVDVKIRDHHAKHMTQTPTAFAGITEARRNALQPSGLGWPRTTYLGAQKCKQRGCLSYMGRDRVVSPGNPYGIPLLTKGETGNVVAVEGWC